MRVLIDAWPHPEGLARLRALSGVTVDVIEDYSEKEARALPVELIGDKEVVLCTFPPANLSDMKSLRLIQITSSGYSQLFGLGLAERGIHACNARGTGDVYIAEWNTAMMINLCKNVRGMIHNQEQHLWDRSASSQREVRGSTLGIWGYGGIGRETARIAKALGMRVYVLERDGVERRDNFYLVPGTGDPDGVLPDRAFVHGQEMEFLSGLDFLVMATPLTDHTRGMVGEKELQALPSTAYVLNSARGPLIVEEALLRALREGWIAGAALDAHYYYPMPAEHPLWGLPNVIMTPHISDDGPNPHTGRLWDLLAQNVTRLMRGEVLLNELTPEQLAGE